MAYTALKEKLEQLLAEDLSNRANLQETRRHLFLNSEGSKVQQQLIEQKQSEITSLNTLVEKKKTIVQLKEDEIAVLREQMSQLEENLVAAQTSFENEKAEWTKKINSVTSQQEQWSDLQNKVSTLSIQNDEYASKIRELIHHIDAQNTEIEQLKLDLESAIDAKNKLVDSTILEQARAEITALKSELEMVKESFSVSSKQLIDKTAEIGTLKHEIESLKSNPVVDSKALEEQSAELEKTQARADLLAESEQRLKMLVSSQNGELESLQKQATTYKKQIEDIAAGWQQQQEQLLADNSNLLAELVLLKENLLHVPPAAENKFSEEEVTAIKTEKELLSSQLQAAYSEIASLKESISAPVSVPSISDEEVEKMRQEKERLSIELNATRYELDVTMQQREEKIILLQGEIATLQNQVIALSDSLNRESVEKQLIGTQLEQLKSLLSEKEQHLHAMANNPANEDFIDKLMFQANRLNDEKHRLELLYSESEAELTLVKTNLASLSQLIEEQKNSISGLEETDKHVKLAQTLMLQVSDKTAAKQAINELVREIDRCIALLSE